MANLLEKASIILTPTAYDDAKVLTVIPDDASGDFDFSRGSAATRVNAQGLVEDVQILSSNLVQNGDFSQIGSEEVTNGNFSQEGSELITNGDFATDSDWIKGTGWTISGGKANTDGTTSADIKQNNITVVGKHYKYSFTVSNSGVGVIDGRFRDKTTGTPIVNFSSEGTYEGYFTAIGNLASFVNLSGNTTSYSIDNVSVKEVGQDWTLGTNWSIGEDKITSNASGLLQQSTSELTYGKTYKTSFEITEYTSGGVKLYSGSGSDTPSYQTSLGTHVVYFVANGNTTSLYSNNFIGSVTNISVKEVGQDWTAKDGDIVSVNSSGLVFDNSSGNGSGGVFQNIGLSDANKYKMTATMQLLTGASNGTFSVFSSSANGTGQSIIYTGSTLVVGGDSVTETFEFSPATGDVSIQFFCDESNATYKISNISILEITDDTNLPRINYSGFTYQDSLGSEEVVNGGFDNGTNAWGITNASYEVLNGELKIYNQTSNPCNSFQTVSGLIVGKQYKVSATSRLGGSGGNVARASFFGNTFASSSGQSVTETIIITASSTTATISLFVYGTSLTEGYFDNVSVKEYLGQEVVPDSGCGAWLFEPQSTNLVINSNSNFITNNSTINPNNVISPDGSLNAYKATATTTSSSFVRTDTLSFAAISTFSVFLKYGNNQWHQIINAGKSGNFVNVDILNGVFGTNGSTTENLSIEDYGNGWYRVSGTFIAAANSSTLRVYSTNSSSSPFAGGTAIIGSYYYGFGFQVEALSYATSYIPTEGTIKTRNQDVCNNGGDVSLINSSEGVLYAEISALADGVNGKYLSIGDGSYSNYIYIRITGVLNEVKMGVIKGGLTQASKPFVVPNLTQFNKLALSYSQDLFKFYVNGTLIFTDTNGDTFSVGTLSNLTFNIANSPNNFNGNTKALGVWKEALTDAELRSLTYPTPTAATFDLDFNTIATDFTFTRNSEATFVNAQGLIQSTNEIGAEEITNGDFEDGSTDWVLSGLTTIGNGVASFVDDGTNTNSAITQTNVISINKTYKITFDVVRHVLGGIQVRVGGATAVTNELLQGVGSYTMYINSGPTSGSTSFQIKRWGGLVGWDFDIDNVSVKEYITETNTPRLDYSTGAEAFLLEPQRTNLIPYSEDFTVWNQIQNVNLISNSTISPSGENNATKFLSTTGSSKVRNNFSAVSGTTYTFSVYCKNIDATFVRLLAYDGANEFSANVVSQINTSTWTKVSLTFTSANTSNSGQVQIARDLPDGQSLYFWGAQLEGSSYATSYIPTSGTIVTRNQELCVDATPVINSEEGVLYAEIAKQMLNNDVIKLISLNSGSSDADSVTIGFHNSTKIYARVRANGVNQFLNTTVATNENQFYKVALRYKSGNISLWIDGVEIATSTSTFSFNLPLSDLSFDYNGNNTLPFFGNTKGLKVYPKALADVELQDLTTI